MKPKILASLIQALQLKLIPVHRLVPSKVERLLKADKESYIYRFSQHIKNKMSSSKATTDFSPPKCVFGMKVLDREKFCKTVNVPSFLVPNENVQTLMKSKEVKKILLSFRRTEKIVQLDADNPLKDKFKLILLNPLKVSDSESIKPDIKKILVSCGVDFSTWHMMQLDLTYNNWNHSEILGAILPSDNQIVAGFSTVGHIVHVNLRDHLIDYKDIIGQVLLDKITTARTVVNKLNTIDNTFRNFQMEVIAGEKDFIAVVKEHGSTFKMDFSKVYWNTRLSNEHQHVVNICSSGDVIFDMFAGIGPFAIPAAKKKCIVYANDLNPESFNWLNENIKINKIKVPFKTFNLDGRIFAQEVIKPQVLKLLSDNEKRNVHIVMNLPAIAVEFTDVFSGLFVGSEEVVNNANIFPSIIVYCYCFYKGEDADTEIKEQLESHMGTSLCEGYKVRQVRNVAPNKEMYCATFSLSKHILLNNGNKQDTISAGDFNEPNRKKIKCDKQS